MKYLLALLGVLGLALSAPAQAQKWPERTVKLVVPYPAGGNVDGAARIIADRLQAAFGQPFVVENKAGAGGLVGSESVAKSEPDGYTLLLGANGPILFAPEMASRRAYEWRRDFVPITMVSLTPIVLQVNPSVAAKSVKELFELARREPGKLTMSSPGPGTTNHLLSEKIQGAMGLSWVTVQYKGNAPATSDLIAGHVNFNFDQVSVALPYIKDGKTRALAITGDKRAVWLPDVPTFKEAGFPEIDGATFTGLMAPAKTPPEIVARLNAELGKILSDPAVKSKFEALGAEARPMSAEAFRQYLEKEDATWIPLIRKTNIKAQ
ncbi:MAG: tripartite tricarboxylate transporter substrate binding protein [Hyphomicrobiaceae bacterium]|nr:MAG: tripartite tricarboxylate transporter substrate binding protein [Hyphomicrobiaceae bacterium]